MDLNYIDNIASAIRQRVPDEVLADEDGADDLFRLYGLLALAKGIDTTADGPARRRSSVIEAVR